MDPVSESGSKLPLDEVFRRVGRNLLLLQQIELLLKTLLSRSGFAGYVSEIPAKAAKRAAEISRKTLGQLTQQYHDEVLGQDDLFVAKPAELREPWISFNFRLEGDTASAQRDKAVLDALVVERNELTHTFLTRWSLPEAGGIAEAIRFLNAQRERALPVLKHIQSALEAIEQGRKQAAEALMSEEAQRQFELVWLQQSQIVQMLLRVTETSSRPDGWTDLAAAGRLVREFAPDDAANIKERYGVSSLKKLLVAAEMFEVAEEPDGGGHLRTVYRPKRPI